MQVLAVTMHQNDHSLLNKMRISSDALIGNQADRFEKESFQYEGKKITWYTWDERGVGLNRNNLLMRADADIVLFADDDVVYEEGYQETVLRAFEQHPEADVILFNVVPLPESINPCLITKWHRVRWYNCLKYGAVRVAARLNKLRQSNINFTLLFGGGAKYSSGEDSIFMMDCLRSGLKVYGYPAKIGCVYFNTSSWFQGFTEKYFMDKGVFFHTLSRRFGKLLCLQYCVRCSSTFREHCSRKQTYKWMKQGIALHKKGKY